MIKRVYFLFIIMLLQACSLVQSPEFDNPVDEKYNPPPKEVIA